MGWDCTVEIRSRVAIRRTVFRISVGNYIYTQGRAQSAHFGGIANIKLLTQKVTRFEYGLNWNRAENYWSGLWSRQRRSRGPLGSFRGVMTYDRNVNSLHIRNIESIQMMIQNIWSLHPLHAISPTPPIRGNLGEEAPPHCYKQWE